MEERGTQMNQLSLSAFKKKKVHPSSYKDYNEDMIDVQSPPR